MTQQPPPPRDEMDRMRAEVERLERQRQQAGPLPDRGNPNIMPVSPSEMQAIVEKIASGGFTDLDEANAAAKKLFSINEMMLKSFEDATRKKNEFEVLERQLKADATAAVEYSRELAGQLHKLCHFIEADGFTFESLRSEAATGKAIASHTLRTLPVEMIEGFDLQAQWRAMKDDSALNRAGVAAKERILDLLDRTVAYLSKMRKDNESIKVEAKKLIDLMGLLKVDLEAAQAQLRERETEQAQVKPQGA